MTNGHLEWFKTQFVMILLAVLLMFFAFMAWSHHAVDDSFFVFCTDMCKQILAAILALVTSRAIASGRKDDVVVSTTSVSVPTPVKE